MMQSLRRYLKSFRKAERGTISVELVTIVPLLLVITLGLITFFDAFKAKTTAARTATVISDMVSRETNAITPNYMNGIHAVMLSMIESDPAPEFRLTAFTWNETNQEYRVRWSDMRGQRVAHNTTSLNILSDKLPQIKNGQRAILLETWVDYEPLTNFGMEQSTTFSNRLVAAQRFVPQLCYMQNLSDDNTTALC